MTPPSYDDWQTIFHLRGTLADPYRSALRRLIRYAEALERKLDRVRDALGDKDV
jgi:hypothetical protein